MIEPGAIIKGRQDAYTIEAEHARGGFGITYRARRERDGSAIIVKVLRLDRLGDWKALELFEREASVLRGLSHPGIPAFIDTFPLGDPSAPEAFALAQDFVPGSTLRQLMRARRSFTQAEMLAWFGDVLEILAYLHGLSPPVVHRDVTPKNIILRPDGRAMLVDFGTVQAVLRTGQSVSSTAAGTFGYAPMEQFVGRAVPASDLYGLGMSFLAVASGREPERMPMDGVRVNVRGLLVRDARFDARLAALIEKMTEADPRRRLPDAVTALQQLAVIRGLAPASELAANRERRVTSLNGAARVADPESYLALLSSRLIREGFTVHQGGKLGNTPLALKADRRGGTLRSANTFRIYAAVDDQLDGLAGPGEPIGADHLVDFTGAAVAPHAAEGVAASRLISGRTIVVPVVISQGGVAPHLQTQVGRRIAADDGIVAVPVVVDLEHTAVHVVPEPGTLGEDPEGILPYLWWLTSPRIMDKPKSKAKTTPLLRIALGLVAGIVLLGGAGVVYRALAPAGENYLVYAADPDSHRLAIKRFFVKGAVLGTDVVAASAGQKPDQRGSMPADAYLCSLSGSQLAYSVRNRDANAVTYWRASLGGKSKTEIAHTPYSFWWSCAIHEDRVAFATGDQTQLGSIQIVKSGASPEPAKGTQPGDKFPAWFPDGKRLAISAGPWGQERMVQLDLETGERTSLTAETDNTRGAESRPVVSPSGTRIAFYRTGRRAFGDEMRRPTSDVYDLYWLDLVSRQAKLTVQEVCFATSAAWLSDDELVYGKWSNGECAAFVYDLRSDEARLLSMDY